MKPPRWIAVVAMFLSLTLILSACAQTKQIVQNGGFDSDTNHWDRPYGRLEHATSEHNTGPGAAQLVTDGSPDLHDHLGTFGQCIDLSSELDNWPEVDDIGAYPSGPDAVE